MTREALIKSVKKKYAGADVATIDAVLNTLTENNIDLTIARQRASGSNDKTVQPVKKPERELKFVGENPPPENYGNLSFQERGALHIRLKEQNQDWLDEKFATLQAAWLMVMNGEIIASGQSLKTIPQIEHIHDAISRYGKQPFVFVNDFFLAIEESHVAWHPTAYQNDHYPTVPINLRTDSGAVEIIADFDTGAASSFVDYDLLEVHNVIERQENDYVISSRHLDKIFSYITKLVNVETILTSGESLSHKLPFHCVSNWHTSPFVSINPHRQALAGRDLFLELQPNILLDFAKRRTQILASESV
jgi:hypothetical protein